MNIEQATIVLAEAAERERIARENYLNSLDRSASSRLQGKNDKAPEVEVITRTPEEQIEFEAKRAAYKLQIKEGIEEAKKAAAAKEKTTLKKLSELEAVLIRFDTSERALVERSVEQYFHRFVML